MEATIGAWLRAERLKAGMSQRELARAAGLSAAAISMLERGLRGQETNIATVRRICRALDVPADAPFAILEAGAVAV